MPSQLDRLYDSLEYLKSREHDGEDVSEQIKSIQSRIEASGDINVHVTGDATGNAIGHGASVTHNQQNIRQNTYYHTHYGSRTESSSSPEVIAGRAVSGMFSHMFARAPRAVSVSIVTALPVLALFNPDTVAVGLILLLTISPLGAYVLWETQFFQIVQKAYEDKKLVLYGSWLLTGLGILIIIFMGIAYLVGMAILTAFTDSMRSARR